MPCLPKDPGNIAANGRNPANHLGCFWNEHSWINYKPQLVQEFYHPQLKKILMLLHVFLHKILSLSIFQALPFGPKKASLPILWQHPTSTLPCRLCRAWRPCQPCRLCLLCQGWASQKIDFFAPLNPSSWTTSRRRSPLNGSMDFDLVYRNITRFAVCTYTICD